MAASSLLDVCRFNPTAGGTTDWTYSSAVTGYQSPSAAGVVNGAQYSYRAESADLSQWEVGTGAYNTGTGVLSRTTVLFNSSGTTSKINFTVAPQVAIVALKEDLKVPPTRQVFTSGSGTYTTPANCLYIRVRMVGGGGGGGGTGTSGQTAGGAGGSSTFNTTTTAPGGSGGGTTNGNTGGAGGAAGANVDFSIAGTQGDNPDQNIAQPPGAPGASSMFGGGGGGGTPANVNGISAPANSGAGGGGGGSGSGVACAAGGGSGAYSEKTFSSPASSYAYAVGAGGAAGTTGTSGGAGGSGGSGLIIVDEYYN